MNNRQQTDLYLNDLNLLTEALYLCWHNSYCNTTKQINEEKLREQIRSYGFYIFKNKTKKELPLCFRAKLKFKTLTWVNEYTDVFAEDKLCESYELYMLAIKEIKNGLFKLKNRAERVASANIIIRELDKSYVHNKSTDKLKLNLRLKELFGYVLNHHFIAEDNITTLSNDYKVYPIYDLTVRLINHFNFIDKLIELFLCFDICLIFLADKSKCNLYIFNNKYELTENRSTQNDVYQKFNSSLSDDCLIKILQYLFILIEKCTSISNQKYTNYFNLNHP